MQLVLLGITGYKFSQLIIINAAVNPRWSRSVSYKYRWCVINVIIIYI